MCRSSARTASRKPKVLLDHAIANRCWFRVLVCRSRAAVRPQFATATLFDEPVPIATARRALTPPRRWVAVVAPTSVGSGIVRFS